MFIRPRAGLTIRKPGSPAIPLAASGEDVADSPHWRRRLRDGDVERCDEPEPETAPNALETDTEALP